MKKIIVASVVACALVGAAVLPASALTVADVQTQIQNLLSQIAQLTQQLNILKSQQQVTAGSANVYAAPGMPAGHRICTLLNRNLSSGISGDDVRSVQEFLQSEGFLTTAPTGYFGPVTAQAVAKWQAREGLSSVGAFGPMSRERIKIWCGGGGGWANHERFSATPTQGSAPLTVTFDTWLSGFRSVKTYYVVDFGDGATERAADCYAPADGCLSPGQNKHVYTQNGTYTALLNKVDDPCAQSTPACKAPVQVTPVAKLSIVVGPVTCTKEYVPVCASKQIYCITTPCNPVQQTYSNKCMAAADGATILYQGQCRDDWKDPANDSQCKVWSDGCNTCSRQYPGGPGMCTLMACALGSDLKPYCKERFDSKSNKPPTISGFSGPTTLRVNETGTWTIKASDPENGQLSYDIRWGDESPHSPNSGTVLDAREFVQSTTFTHAYFIAGTYTVTIVVRDALGQEAKTTATVKVGDHTAQFLSASPAYGSAPLSVIFSGRVNSKGYSIDFGDGKTSGDIGCVHGGCPGGGVGSDVLLSHTYSSPGTYTAKLRIHFASNAGNCAGVDCNVVATAVVHVSANTACTLEYAPVCGRHIRTSCTPGNCHVDKTYSNRCSMETEGATFLYEGQCQSGGYACTADAYQCPNGQWVGRTGPNCQFACTTVPLPLSESSVTGGASAGTNSCTYAGTSYPHDALKTTTAESTWLPQRCCNGTWRSSLGNMLGAPVCSSSFWPQNQ